jgi:hypothetical protein
MMRFPHHQKTVRLRTLATLNSLEFPEFHGILSRAEQPYGTAMPALMFFAIRQLLHSLLLLQFVSSLSHVETFVVRLIF